MTIVYLDESGYTGYDLYNKDQPVFVLAATDFLDDEVENIIRPIFKGYQGVELKHSKLAKALKGQQNVIDLIKALQPNKDRITSYILHKRFSLFQQLVDIWLEAALYKQGYDFYENQQHLYFCNDSFIILQKFIGEKNLNDMLYNYQKLMLNPSKENYKVFWDKVSYLASQYIAVRDILEPLLLAEKSLGYSHMDQKSIYDIGFSIAKSIVSWWQNQKDDQIMVIHDRSDPLMKKRELWNLLNSPDAPKASFGGEGAYKVQFPSKVASSDFGADSKQYLQLQLCDLVAGATAACFSSVLIPGKYHEYGKKLRDAGIEEFIINNIWPRVDFHVDPDTNFEYSAALDYIAELMNNKNGNF